MDYIVTLGEREAALVRDRIDFVIESVERELKIAGEEARSDLSAEHVAWIQIQKMLVP